jgi:ribosome-binding protein aMBF1 (putative translation factor)
MRFHGRLLRDGKFWLAELPILDAMTQGRTRKEALAMAKDLVETLADRSGFSVTVHLGSHADFEVSSSDTRTMVSLVLRRLRQRKGVSIAQAAERLGATSPEIYARYESGTAVPTLEELTDLLDAVCPGEDFVLDRPNGE